MASTSKAHSRLPINASRCGDRRGTGTLDLFVSFTLLVTVLSISTPLMVRYGRLIKSHRNYRLALDEVSNQLDRLSVRRLDELPEAMRQLSPSAFIRERLTGVRLTGELQPAEAGARVALTLSWDELGRPKSSVTLSGWTFSASQPSTAATREGTTP